MPNEKVLLKAEAGRLGIEGYRQMTQDELQAAINSAKGSTAPAKGKGKTAVSENGASAAKVETAPATTTKVSKGKTPSTSGKGKSAPAKSRARKSSPAKATAAKGTAKRPTTTKTATKGRTTAVKTKTAVTKGRTKPVERKAKTVKKEGQAAKIDRSQIDWTAESNIGQSGKRKLVMDALRKYRGDYDKCYDALEVHALEWYPNALNTYPNSPDKTWAAQLMVRWLINRVAYDFVMKTDQHKPGSRAAYGAAKDANNIARRKMREDLHKEREQAARARKAKVGTQRRAKVAKPAGGRTAASRGKPAAKGRATVAKGKGR